MEGLGGRGQAGDDTAMGRAASGVVAMYAELPSLGPVWERAPLQALAKMHTLVAVPVTPEDVGRPRTGEPQDPLHLGTSPTPQEVPARLDGVGQRITAPTSAPALVVAAVVHAELMTLQPFTYGSGLRPAPSTAWSSRAAASTPTTGRCPRRECIPKGGRPMPAHCGVRHGAAEAVAAWVRFYCAAVAAGTEGLAALVQ